MVDELIGYRGQDDDEMLVLEADGVPYNPAPITRFRLAVPGVGVFSSDAVPGLFEWPVTAAGRDGDPVPGLRVRPSKAAIPAGRYPMARLVAIEPGYPAGRTWATFALRMMPEVTGP